MRKRTRTIELTVETERRVETRRQAAREFKGYCGICAAEVVMVTPDEAARLASVTTRTVYRWVEAGKVHFAETPQGLLSICAKSLRW